MGTNILGGWLSGIFGARRVWGVGVFIASIVTVVTPVSARYSYKVVIVLRVILGLSQGVSFPSMHTMLGKWAPQKDRTKLASFIYSGQNVGYIVTYAMSGALCSHGFDNGWGSIFYITGIWSFVWVAAWLFLAADTPEQHPTISEAERNYIIKGRGKISHRDIVIPWLAIAKSRAMWVCLSAHISNNWLNYTLLTGLPTFMKEVLKFDASQNGILSAIPYFVVIFTMLGSGYLADFIRARYLSTTYTRRLFQSIAFLGSGACIVAVGFIDCSNRAVAVVLLSLAVGIEGLCFSGYNVNQVDFAPRYAGVLMGITNTISTVPGILAPTVIGALTPNRVSLRPIFYLTVKRVFTQVPHPVELQEFYLTKLQSSFSAIYRSLRHKLATYKTQDEWKVVFYICGGMCLFGTICFGGFASGELEPWAVVPEEKVVSPDWQEKQEESLGQKQGHLNAGFYQNESVNSSVIATDSIISKL